MTKAFKKNSVFPKILILFCLVNMIVQSCPINCRQIGTSQHGNLVGCQVLNDPYPLRWEARIVLSQDYTWRGLDDLFWIYHNGDWPVIGNCSTATTLPGAYSNGSNITIQHLCYSFNPKLEKGSLLSMWAFNSHSSRFDDPLIFQFTIPGLGENKKTDFQKYMESSISLLALKQNQ